MSFNLENFTDVLGDEICDSQPISWPSSSSDQQETVTINKQGPINRPAKRTGQYGQFRSVEEIDPKYRNVFSYPYFNLVQSNVIEDALYSDKSIVVCAPTGSGKTVVFEMAIVQLLMEIDDKNYTGDFKIIYMAPVKALCTERLSEWYPKFTKLGLLCIEVTGDTDVDFSQLKPYRIIITTPEKWDMLTRRWRDHKGLVEVIKLFLIDEVHILNDESRGPVLEAVVSRMKTIESSAQSAHRIEQLQKQYQGNECIAELIAPPRIRFVAVSATVSNPEDVANWLSNSDKPAVYHKYGDECRPVKLKRVVEGYPCQDGTSIFKFDIILNYKLWPIIQKYHDGKPTLIFCNTRKSVILTAETLSRELTITFNPEQKAKLAALASTIKNKKLQSLVLSGVGCHHAGLLFEERMNIEHAFRNRDLPILITTTTLAMGVNLPAHLVIVKNTQQYVNGAYQEYSISTVLQMVGRAGRPQFDTEATAVIMTRLIDKPRYQALVGGSEPLQSFLHKRLPENLNSEAALGTVSDVAQCVQWLRSTFLYVRAARDPKRYLGLPPNAPQHQISKKIEELCVKAMNGLASSGLITMDEASCIESTEAGRLMSIFYLDLQTMRHVMKINGTENLEDLLRIVCESHELADMHLRIDERRCLNSLNRNNAAATIRFPMKGKINTRQMKLSCIIQAVLGCLPIPDPSLNQEAMKIIRIADRVCKCLVAYVTRPDLISQKPQYFSAVLNSLILAKCVAAHLWENSPYVSKQLKGIGPTFSTLLATAGKVNFSLLEESNPRDLERIMNKAPPSGNVLRKQISLLPKYQLSSMSIDEHTVSIRLFLLNQTYMSENMDQLTAGDAHKSYMIVGDSNNNVLLLTTFKDRDLINVFDGCITYKISRIHNFEHKIFAHCISSNFVGIDVNCEHIFQNLDSDHGFPHPQVNIFDVATTKKTAKKQTSITDTFKERKRKNSSSSEISQSKEKKKRDSALIEKFKFLKESFGITSKELKEDLHRSEAISNKILKDFTPLNKTSTGNTNSTENNVPKNTVGKNVSMNDDRIKEFDGLNIDEINFDDIDSDEFMDDDKINKILNTIECEISKGPNKSSNISFPSSTAMNSEYCNKNAIKSKNIKNTFQTRKRKPINTKSNYNFIELLEKNADLSDNESNEQNPKKDTGFSSAIKENIDKYLNKTHDSGNMTNTTINVLLNNSHDLETITKPQAVSTDVIQHENQPVIHENVEENRKNINAENKSLLNSIQGNETNGNIEDTDKIMNEYLDNTVNDNKFCYGSYATEKNIPADVIQHKNQPEIHETLEENVENIQTENKSLEKSLQGNDIDGNVEDSDKSVNEYLVNTVNNNKSCHGSYATEKSIPTDVIQYKNQPNILETLEENVENIQTENNSLVKGMHIGENIKDADKCVNQYLVNTANDHTSCHGSYATEKSIIMISNDVMNERSIKPPYLTKNEDNYLANYEPRFDDTYEKQLDRNNDLVMKISSDIKNPNNNTLLANEKQKMEMISFGNVNTKRKIPEISTNERLSSNSYCSEQNEHKHSFGRNAYNNQQGEFINKYSHTSTKIDVTTSDTPQHRIHVVRKLKIDLNITEVVSTEKTIKNCTKQKGLRTINEYATKYLNQQEPQSIDSYTPSHEQTNNRKELAIQFPSADIQIEQSLERGNVMEPYKCLDLNAPTCKDYNAKDNDNGINQSGKYLINTVNNNQRAQYIKKQVNENTDESYHNKEDERIVSNETASESKKYLDNILQKYSNLFRNKSAKDIIHTQIDNKDSREKIQLDKPKRPFKITNIDNLSTSLPNSLISQYKTNIPTLTLSRITTVEQEPQRDVVTKDSSEFEDVNNITEYQSLMDENNCIPNTANDYNIDQTMFNPKTLLQCFIKDEQELIPPPPQFGDVTANYSPEYIGFEDTSNPTVDLSHSQDNSTNGIFYESPQEISIFDDLCNAQLNLTPTKEIETWTLSKDTCDDSYLYLNHNKSFTVVNENFPKNRLGSIVKLSRQSKLRQFKFNHKNKMKI